MTRTFADDVRMVLAEVAPELAARITQGRDWGLYGGKADLTFAEFEIEDRAVRIVGKARGIADTRCVDCRWAVYVAQDPGVAPAPCPHIEETT